MEMLNQEFSLNQFDEENFSELGIDTLAVRAGQVRSAEGEHSEALFLTSSYVFGSAQDAADRFSGAQPGNVYSRYTNPTVRMFEERIAALEGAEAAVATSSVWQRFCRLALLCCNQAIIFYVRAVCLVLPPFC